MVLWRERFWIGSTPLSVIVTVGESRIMLTLPMSCSTSTTGWRFSWRCEGRIPRRGRKMKPTLPRTALWHRRTFCSDGFGARRKSVRICRMRTLTSTFRMSDLNRSKLKSLRWHFKHLQEQFSGISTKRMENWYIVLSRSISGGVRYSIGLFKVKLIIIRYSGLLTIGESAIFCFLSLFELRKAL